MMKRSGSSAREENYEHVLMCLICRSLFDDYDHQPKFLPCHHTFCKDCLREYIRQMGDEIECPSCRKVATIPAAGVAALQTNFYVKYIQSLVSGPGGSTDSSMQCPRHSSQLLSIYCSQCQTAMCSTCVKEKTAECPHSCTKPLTTMTEESHQQLDSTFSKANATIETKKVKLEGVLKALSEEKDDALKKIDSTFEGHVHTLNRRATLLKNKVIDIYSENIEKIENDLMEISTAMTCIVSLKDYHEDKISHGDFQEFSKGIEEIAEVNSNIEQRIRPVENHIVFEHSHGMDKYRMCIKDLGRVRCTRPMIPRDEPEGNDAAASRPVSITTAAAAAPCDAGSSPEMEDKALCDNTTASGTVHQQPSPDLPVAASGLLNTMPVPTASPHKSTSPLPPTQSREAFINGEKLSDQPAGAESRASDRIPSYVMQDDDDQPDGKSGKHQRSHKGKCPPCGKANMADSKKSSPSHKESGKKGKAGGTGHRAPTAAPGHPHRVITDRNANTNKVPTVPDQYSATVNANFPHRCRNDKDYYQTVYTSYDEEALLRELRAGDVAIQDTVPEEVTESPVECRDEDSDTLCERKHGRHMEDSDGWMTLSSGDESAGPADEIVPESELTTL